MAETIVRETVNAIAGGATIAEASEHVRALIPGNSPDLCFATVDEIAVELKGRCPVMVLVTIRYDPDSGGEWRTVWHAGGISRTVGALLLTADDIREENRRKNHDGT